MTIYLNRVKYKLLFLFILTNFLLNPRRLLRLIYFGIVINFMTDPRSGTDEVPGNKKEYHKIAILSLVAGTGLEPMTFGL